MFGDDAERQSRSSTTKKGSLLVDRHRGLLSRRARRKEGFRSIGADFMLQSERTSLRATCPRRRHAPPVRHRCGRRGSLPSGCTCRCDTGCCDTNGNTTAGIDRQQDGCVRHLDGSCSTTSEDGDDLNAYAAPSSVSGIAYDVRSQSTTHKRYAGWGVDVGSQSCDANQGVT